MDGANDWMPSQLERQLSPTQAVCFCLSPFISIQYTTWSKENIYMCRILWVVQTEFPFRHHGKKNSVSNINCFNCLVFDSFSLLWVSWGCTLLYAIFFLFLYLWYLFSVCWKKRLWSKFPDCCAGPKPPRIVGSHPDHQGLKSLP